MLRLPDESLALALSWLDYESLRSTAQTCKRLRALCATVDDAVYHRTQQSRLISRISTEFEKLGFVEGIEHGKSQSVQQGFNRGYSEGGRAAFVEAHAQGMLHALVLLRDRLPRDGDGGAWAELADLDRLATEQRASMLAVDAPAGSDASPSLQRGRGAVLDEQALIALAARVGLARQQFPAWSAPPLEGEAGPRRAPSAEEGER